MYIKNKLKPLIVGLILGALLSNGLVYAGNNEYILSLFEAKIIVNGEEKQGSEKAYQYYNGKTFVPTSLNYDGTTYVPLRFFSEILGQTVKYDSKEKAIYVGEDKSKAKEQSPNYLIVLDNDQLVDSIKAFVDFKTSEGYNVSYVVADDIDAAGSNRAEKLRNYMFGIDKKDDLEFVLLIGDPFSVGKASKGDTGGNIPMKYFYYFNNCHANEFISDNWIFDESGKGRENGAIPTDLYYYTDMNWDADKDGYFGETTDDVSIKNKSQFKCLYKLGRIPFSDPVTVDTILQNTIQRQPDYVNLERPLNVLISSGIFLFVPKKSDGAFWTEKFRSNLNTAQYNITTLYEQQGDSHSIYSSTKPLSAQNFSAEWNKGYDIICTISHGGYQRYVWDSDSNRNGIPDDANIFFESFINLPDIKNKSNGFLIMDGCSTAIMEKDRYEQDIPQVPQMLADGLIICGVGTTKSNGYVADIPEFTIYPFWKNTNTTYGGNFQDAIIALYNGFSSDSFDYYHNLYTYCYFGDPSFKMR